MDIDLEKKSIKEFTKEDWRRYNHKRYEKDKKHRLEYQSEYYRKHKLDLQKKGRNRYRVKCGLRLEK